MYPMVHEQSATPFYFNPEKDLIWPTTAVLDNPDVITMLKTCYRET